MWVALLFLLIGLGCMEQGPSDAMAGRWCPVDSLTSSDVEQPVGTLVSRYQPGTAVTRYRLTFDGRGGVVAEGLYAGRFAWLTGDGGWVTDTASFLLPRTGVAGRYEIGQAYLRLAWPYPAAGPTWFWEIARNTVVGPDGSWRTLLDDSEGDAWRFYTRLSWERC